MTVVGGTFQSYSTLAGLSTPAASTADLPPSLALGGFRAEKTFCKRPTDRVEPTQYTIRSSCCQPPRVRHRLSPAAPPSSSPRSWSSVHPASCSGCTRAWNHWPRSTSPSPKSCSWTTRPARISTSTAAWHAAGFTACRDAAAWPGLGGRLRFTMLLADASRVGPVVANYRQEDLANMRAAWRARDLPRLPGRLQRTGAAPSSTTSTSTASGIAWRRSADTARFDGTTTTQSRADSRH